MPSRGVATAAAQWRAHLPPPRQLAAVRRSAGRGGGSCERVRELAEVGATEPSAEVGTAGSRCALGWGVAVEFARAALPSRGCHSCARDTYPPLVTTAAGVLIAGGNPQPPSLSRRPPAAGSHRVNEQARLVALAHADAMEVLTQPPRRQLKWERSKSPFRQHTGEARHHERWESFHSKRGSSAAQDVKNGLGLVEEAFKGVDERLTSWMGQRLLDGADANVSSSFHGIDTNETLPLAGLVLPKDTQEERQELLRN
eukprot:scaffold3306_cov229-Prasinococcus_capsulatus_cf.AAC.1